jgi:hypothetical protein
MTYSDTPAPSTLMAVELEAFGPYGTYGAATAACWAATEWCAYAYYSGGAPTLRAPATLVPQQLVTPVTASTRSKDPRLKRQPTYPMQSAASGGASITPHDYGQRMSPTDDQGQPGPYAKTPHALPGRNWTPVAASFANTRT